MRFDLVYPSWRWSDGHRGTCSGHLLAMAPWRHEIFLNSWYRKEHHVPFYNGYRNQYVYNNKYIHYTYRYLIFFMGTWTFVHQIYLYIYIFKYLIGTSFVQQLLLMFTRATGLEQVGPRRDRTVSVKDGVDQAAGRPMMAMLLEKKPSDFRYIYHKCVLLYIIIYYYISNYRYIESIIYLYVIIYLNIDISIIY